MPVAGLVQLLQLTWRGRYGSESEVEQRKAVGSASSAARLQRGGRVAHLQTRCALVDGMWADRRDADHGSAQHVEGGLSCAPSPLGSARHA